MKLDLFTRAYVEAALWSSMDDEGDALQEKYGADDIAPEYLAKMVEDCREFQDAMGDILADAGNAEQNGHDFWLTRCGHGAGFWDRGYAERVSRLLTDECATWGNVDLYVGDDGRIYGA